VRPVLVSLPRELFEHIKNVTLAADVMFCNGLPFFVTISRDIKLITVEFLPSRTVNSLCGKLRKVLKVYRRGGFAVRTCLMDMEFKPLVDDFDEAIINVTAAREYVGDVKRAIRFIEERARSVVSELPYKHCMPDQFVIHLLYFVTLWINAFPSDSGVSSMYSPREIVTGMRMDYAKHCKARFGAYVEASDDPTITNTLRSRTSPCIVLGPTGNLQGAVKCYNLETKKIVDRREITPLPMPDKVVHRVIKLGQRAKQQRLGSRLKFLNRHQQDFDWDLDADEPGLVEKPPQATDTLPAEIPGVFVESDFTGNETIEQEQEPTDDEHAAAALANANLDRAGLPDELAGVDFDDSDPMIVSDDEEEPDDDDGASIEPKIEETETEDAVEVDGDNTEMAVAEVPGADEDAEADESDGESVETVQAVRRTGRRRKPKPPLTVDFKNYAYAQAGDGVVHINPAVLEQAKEDLKITSNDLFSAPVKETGRTGVSFRSPATAGISRSALHGVTMAGLHMPAPKVQPGEHLAEDHVVMHILGVVLAQQYSVNKGIHLVGDRVRESVMQLTPLSMRMTSPLIRRNRHWPHSFLSQKNDAGESNQEPA
jgi:hypothetical protein